MLSVIVPVKVCLGGTADSAATARRLKARLPRTPVLVMRRIVMRRIAPLVVIPSPLASRAKVPGPRRERAPYREKAINKVALFAPAYSGGGRGISPKRAPTVCLAGRLEALHFPEESSYSPGVMRCAVDVPAFIIHTPCPALSASPVDCVVAPGTAMVMCMRACSWSAPMKWYHTDPYWGFTRVPSFSAASSKSLVLSPWA